MAMDDGTKAGLLCFVEASGTSLLLGYLHGRKGEMPSKANVPLDAAVGFGMAVLAAVLGPKLGKSKILGGTPQDHMFNIATGSACYFSGSMGGQMGQKARLKAKELTGPQGADAVRWNGGDEAAQKAAALANPWRNNRTITAGVPGAMPMSTPAWSGAGARR